MYDYYLGGKDNFPADRAAAERIIALLPDGVVRTSAVQNRKFLMRVVRHLAQDLGVRQFLDIGTGLPTMHSVHQVAQAVAPDSRVVYVDHDPVVLAHSRNLLHGNDRAAIVGRDLRDPPGILADPRLRELLDFSQPIAVLLVAILHFISDDDDPLALVRSLMEPMPAGSFLVVSHFTADSYAQAEMAVQEYENATSTLHSRRRSQVVKFFADYDMIAPGSVVWTPQWRRPVDGPEDDPELAASPCRSLFWCGVGRKVTAAVTSALPPVAMAPEAPPASPPPGTRRPPGGFFPGQTPGPGPNGSGPNGYGLKRPVPPVPAARPHAAFLGAPTLLDEGSTAAAVTPEPPFLYPGGPSPAEPPPPLYPAFPPAANPAVFRPDIPNVARMYDYMLGGKDNYPADRAAAERTFAVLGEDVVRGTVRQNRDFLGRAVRYLAAELGIRQFLDIGTGLPTMNSVHEVTRTVAPDSRVVYVDNDPVVLAHGRNTLNAVPGTMITSHDLRDPWSITADARIHELLDFRQPIAVLLIAILHFVADADDPWGVVAALMAATPPGSCLVISHLTADHYRQADEAAAVYADTSEGLHLRSRAAVESLFCGLPLLAPGEPVYAADWHPGPGTPPSSTPGGSALWCGVAFKP
jgi:hypothetical protein